MVIETRAGVPIEVLDERLQRLQTQIKGNSGAIEQLYTKFDRLEAKVDIGCDSLQAIIGSCYKSNRWWSNQLCNQGKRSKLQIGFKERSVKNNARFTPPFQGHFDTPYEEPWLGRRQGRQQGQQTQFEPHVAPPRHGMHFGGASSNWVQTNFGEQLPITPPSIHRLPIGAKESNALSMRAPNHEVQTMVQPEPQREAQSGQGGGAPIVGKQPSIFEPIEPIPMKAESRNVRPMRAPNHDVHFNPNQPRFGMPYDDPFEPRQKRLNGGANVGCMVKNIGVRKGFQGSNSSSIHVDSKHNHERHASQAREPRNAPWPQGDVVEPWYDHGGGRGNCGRARNYQGPQDRDPYGKNQDPLQRQQGRQAREPRAMELEFPRFKGGDPTSWMFRAIQYFEYYQVHDASKVMHASYHLDDDALIWFQSCEHDLGCWDNFARAIQLRFGPPSYDDPMELLIKLKHVNSIEEYKGLFESLSNRIRNLSSMHKLSCFMSGLKDEVRLAIKMQGPRTLGETIEEQYSSQEVAAQFGPKVATQSDPKVAECDPEVAAQIVPKVVAQFDPKVAAQLDHKVAAQFDHKVAAQLNPKVAAQMDPKVADPKPISAKPTMMVQKLTPKQMLERRRKGLCYNCDENWTIWHTCKAMKLYLIKEVQEEEGTYVTSDEEEEMVEWCEERRNTKEGEHQQGHSSSFKILVNRKITIDEEATKKQLEDSSSIRPQQDHNP
uniref:Ty3 transposon capsid-like protein domain-containing protein n=1 Tax=Fagus sylvatica TaxID=28930 RepID=A0A2N9FSP7_FAGSY